MFGKDLRHRLVTQLNFVPLNFVGLHSRGGSSEPWNGYVKDNLVFQLDFAEGFVAGDTTTWTDLIGGKVLTLQSGTAEFDNGIKLCNGTFCFPEEGIITNTGNCTIEICYELVESDNAAEINICGKDGTSAGIAFSSALINAGGGGKIYLAELDIAQLGSLSVLGSKVICLDGESKAYDEGEMSIPSGETIVGANNIIYKSIRVYDCKLTDTQIKQNYMVDYLRFCPVPDGALLTADGKYFRTADVEWFKTYQVPTYDDYVKDDLIFQIDCKHDMTFDEYVGTMCDALLEYLKQEYPYDESEYGTYEEYIAMLNAEIENFRQYLIDRKHSDNSMIYPVFSNPTNSYMYYYRNESGEDVQVERSEDGGIVVSGENFFEGEFSYKQVRDTRTFYVEAVIKPVGTSARFHNNTAWSRDNELRIGFVYNNGVFIPSSQLYNSAVQGYDAAVGNSIVSLCGSCVNRALSTGFLNNEAISLGGTIPSEYNHSSSEFAEISGDFVLYAIRVYKRILTDEERTANYNVDKVRFGIQN